MSNPLSERRAVYFLRNGSALVHMQGGNRRELKWFVVPGGPVDNEVSERIRKRPDIVSNHDGLWPGYDQTWRMIR